VGNAVAQALVSQGPILMPEPYTVEQLRSFCRRQCINLDGVADLPAAIFVMDVQKRLSTENDTAVLCRWWAMLKGARSR
jgi:hypothetical protein